MLVIDTSTVSATTARTAAARLAPRGVQFLDCPVSGGVEGARDGKLAIMCGGHALAFERAASARARLPHHHLVRRAARARPPSHQPDHVRRHHPRGRRAMAFAQAQGLLLQKVVDTFGQGAGSSWYFVHRAPNMIRGSYPAGFRVRLHEKDLRICRDMAAACGVALPVVGTCWPSTPS